MELNDSMMNCDFEGSFSDPDVVDIMLASMAGFTHSMMVSYFISLRLCTRIV
jgi:hypothetical protein